MTILDTLRAELAKLQGFRDMPRNLKERESRLLRVAIRLLEEHDKLVDYIQDSGAVFSGSKDVESELEAIWKGETDDRNSSDRCDP